MHFKPFCRFTYFSSTIKIEAGKAPLFKYIAVNSASVRSEIPVIESLPVGIFLGMT